MGILESKTSFDCLDEALRVAGAALTLVTKRAREIVAAQVSEVIFIWNEGVRNFVRTLVLPSPFLSLGGRRCEFI